MDFHWGSANRKGGLGNWMGTKSPGRANVPKMEGSPVQTGVVYEGISKLLEAQGKTSRENRHSPTGTTLIGRLKRRIPHAKHNGRLWLPRAKTGVLRKGGTKPPSEPQYASQQTTGRMGGGGGKIMRFGVIQS